MQCLSLDFRLSIPDGETEAQWHEVTCLGQECTRPERPSRRQAQVCYGPPGDIPPATCTAITESAPSPVTRRDLNIHLMDLDTPGFQEAGRRHRDLPVQEPIPRSLWVPGDTWKPYS